MPMLARLASEIVLQSLLFGLLAADEGSVDEVGHAGTITYIGN